VVQVAIADAFAVSQQTEKAGSRTSCSRSWRLRCRMGLPPMQRVSISRCSLVGASDKSLKPCRDGIPTRLVGTSGSVLTISFRKQGLTRTCCVSAEQTDRRENRSRTRHRRNGASHQRLWVATETWVKRVHRKPGTNTSCSAPEIIPDGFAPIQARTAIGSAAPLRQRSPQRRHLATA
jgi:hypothetical protein